MSARASAYAKALIECPNGEMITRGEKLVLIVLADSHQDKAKRFTYPSIDTIAPEAMCDRRSCQRYLASLERKGVIRRLRPANQGRGMQVFYFFAALDEIPEGWQSAALFFDRKGGKRASEGRQKGGNSGTASIRNINVQLELETTPPNPPQAGGGGVPEQNPGVAVDVNAAVDQVMQGCGFTARRLRSALRAVIELELGREDAEQSAGEVGAAMVAAWRDFTSMDTLLRAKWGARRFFEEGYWNKPRSWHWDFAAIQARRLANEAGMGSVQ